MPLNNSGRIRNKNRSTRSRSRRISSTTSSTTPSTTVAHYEARSDENLHENNYGCVDQVEKMVGFWFLRERVTLSYSYLVQSLKLNCLTLLSLSLPLHQQAGSLSCLQFLNKFSQRYCNHDYIKRNCCASHAIVCLNNEE